jgi:hypothetical protein
MAERLNEGDQVRHRGARQLGRRPDGRDEGGSGQAKPVAVEVVDQDVRHARVLVGQGRAAKTPRKERVGRVEDDDVVALV